jgi:membrane-associated protease RseP (regulator of RpoE activity)
MWRRKKKEMQNEVRAIREALYGILEIQTVYHTKKDIFVKVSPYLGPDNWRRVVLSRLSSLGYTVEFSYLDRSLPAGHVVLHIRRPGEQVKESVLRSNVILFLLTVITTFVAGAFYVNGLEAFQNPLLIPSGAPFALPLLLILTFHEFGHYVSSRRRRIEVSLPYFIPGIPPLGTFGAVIRSRSPFRNRRDLLDVGAAGPIAGFVIAVVVIVFGLSHSNIVAMTEVPGGTRIFGESLVLRLLSWVVLDVPEGHGVALSPMAFAGWAGILVTMLNLLPIGQLDGGHIMYALLGRHQRKVALAATFALIPLGSFLWPGWFIWVVLVLVIKVGHPPTLNDQVPLDSKRKAIGWLAMVIFILSFTPVPIK